MCDLIPSVTTEEQSTNNAFPFPVAGIAASYSGHLSPSHGTRFGHSD